MPIDPYLVTRALNRFPSAGGPLLDTSRPGLRARAAAHAAYNAARQHLANLAAARDLADPEISGELLPELREELSKALRGRTEAQFTDPLSGYVRVAERAADAATAAADPFRPRVDPDSATQAIRTDQAWNNHVRPMLEAGKQWDEIIPTLDADGLLAVERFAPGYESRIRDRFQQNEIPAALDGIRTMSDRRLVDIAPPEGREALREAQDAAATRDYIRTVSAWVTNTGPREAVAVSIGLTQGAYQVGAQRPVDTSPEAQAEYAASLGGQLAAAAA